MEKFCGTASHSTLMAWGLGNGIQLRWSEPIHSMVGGLYVIFGCLPGPQQRLLLLYPRTSNHAGCFHVNHHRPPSGKKA